MLGGRILAGDTHQISSAVPGERNSDDRDAAVPVPVNSPHDQAILVGLDGWHLFRAPLDVFPERQITHDRRGSHRTLDGAGCISFDFVCQLRDTQ